MPGEISEIGLVNFRVFKEASFELRPITILTGTNNSGKSSLVKSLLLLSANEDISELNFSKGNHNLGNFVLTCNNLFDKENSISNLKIDLVFNNKLKDENRMFPLFRIDAINQKLELVYLQDGENAYLRFLKLSILNNPIIAFWNIDNELTYRLNISYIVKENRRGLRKLDQLLNELQEGGILPWGFDGPYKGFEYISDPFINSDIIEKINSLYNDNDKTKIVSLIEETIFSMFNTKIEEKFLIGTEGKHKISHGFDSLVEYDFYPFQIINYLNFLKENEEYLSKNNIDTSLLLPLHEFLKEKNCGQIVNENFQKFVTELLSKLQRVFQITKGKIKIKYVPAFRSKPERIFLVDENSNMFNMQLNNFEQIYHKEEVKEFINYWLKEFELGDEFEYERIEGIASRFFIIKNKTKYSIADMGFGTLQLLPIIISLAELINFFQLHKDYSPRDNHFLIIEEPETNLHPKLQSLIADMIVDALNKINVKRKRNRIDSFSKIIIETHSEYLIRKLQYLTAKKEIAPEDTVIYYLNSPKVVKETGVEQVVKIEIKEDGSLTDDFGPGFFDEAAQLVTDMIEARKRKYSMN